MARRPRVQKTNFPVRLTKTEQQHAMRLLAQQCWLFGCDIRAEHGNQLCAYGLERIRPQNPQLGSSLYCTPADRGATLCLWAFGIYVGWEEIGGVFLDRFEYAPRVIRHPSATAHPHLPDDVDIASEPHATHDDAYNQLISWVIHYEHWIRATSGQQYRDRCIAAWPKHRWRIPTEHIVPGWQLLLERATPSHTLAHSSLNEV